MQRKKVYFMMVMLGGLFIIAVGVWLASARPVSAQCGSSASSCKNCHEVQGQMPVNNDGTSWHKSHAFGDFCYICHAGNQQATDKAAAHEGLVPPLEDVQASCQQCHVNDLEARAQVYADALGVAIGSGSGGQAPAGNEPAAQVTESAPTAASVSNCNEVVVDDPNLVDYAAHYEQTVLGKKPVNWGNVILLVMVAGMLVGGGGFVVMREKLVNVKFGDTRAVDAEYPADVVEMLPQISGLKPGARKALKSVLESKKAEKALDLLDTLISKEE